MAQQKFTNNAASKLASSLTTGATTLSVTATEGSKFPTLAAGEWSMVNLIKLVAGLPVTEIVKVTARTGDLFTILRAQEGTTATTFAAGDLIELRPTAGGLSLMAQRDGDNTYSGSNTFNGAITVPTQSAGDNSSKAASTAYADTAANARAEKGINSSITKLTALQSVNFVDAQPTMDFDETDQAGAAGKWRMVFTGNTWRFDKNTAVARDYSTYVSPLQVDGAGLVGIGRAPTDSHPFSVGNSTDYGALGNAATVSYVKLGGVAGTGSFIIKFDRSSGITSFAQGNAGAEVDRMTISAAGALTLSNGLTVNGAATSIQGGALATLANNGFQQIGTSAGLNVVYDFTQIQARNNGAATTLNINSLGGLVQIGAGGLSVDGVVFARNNTNIKVALHQGATPRGFIGADATYCATTINAAGSLTTTTVDNSGNFTAAGNVTAFSDERLKKDWVALEGDFLECLATVRHGSYTRTDTGLRQVGMVAQDVQQFLPDAIVTHEDGYLSLNYGGVAGVAVVQLAREVIMLRAQMQRANDLIQRLMDKAGA